MVSSHLRLLGKMVEYILMKNQIEKEISDYCSKEKITDAALPTMEFKKGEIKIEFMLEKFDDSDFVKTIKKMREYYSVIELGGGYFSTYEITAKNKENRINLNFDIHAYKPGTLEICNKVTLRKDKELSQEEINFFIELWKNNCKGKNDSIANDKSAKANLEELGVKIYDSNENFSWDCIAGYEKTKNELKESIILPFKHPDIYKGVGDLTRKKEKLNFPRSVLFEGPPGTGKTTAAKIIAHETEMPLIYVPIESVMSCWYGMSEKKLAGIFDYSSQLEKSILFLDEIDSLAGSREKDMHEATRRVLSVLLRKMDGFSSVKNVLTIGATNMASSLDKALLSRFGKTIRFPLPNSEERKSIFSFYAKHLPANSLKSLASMTEKKSGRDIENICEDAERKWARKIISENAIISPPAAEFYSESVKCLKKNKITYSVNSS